jgi:hypothetical protein
MGYWRFRIAIPSRTDLSVQVPNMNCADLIRQLEDKSHPLTANDVKPSVRTILDEMTHVMTKGGGYLMIR